MKNLMISLFISLFVSMSASAFASTTTTYQCRPVEFSEGSNEDFILTIKKSTFSKNEVTWTRSVDSYSEKFPFPKTTATPYAQNEYTEGRTFLKTDINSTLILIYTKNELFIDKNLLQAADEGVVYNYQEDGNLMDTTRVSKTTFMCDRQ